MKNNQMNVNLSNKTIIRIILLVSGAILLYKFAVAARHPLTLIFVAFFLALALNPVVSWIASRSKNRSRALATAVAYFSVIAVLVGFFLLVIPSLVQQTRDFINDVPNLVKDFQNQEGGLAELARKYKINEQLNRAASDFASDFGGSAAEPIINTGKRIGSTFISIIAVLVLTFMMLVEGPQWFKRAIASVPERRLRIARRMYGMVTGFVNGQVILALMAGSSSLIALIISSSIIDVSINAVALAAIVALFALIPMIGNIISALLVVFITLLSSPALALIMLIFFIVYQQIENVTLQPIIQSRKNELSPLIVFIAALTGVSLGGILGALAAIPIAGCVKILLEEYYATRQPKNSS
jgi:predicted PurR-regulated permease PerM